MRYDCQVKYVDVFLLQTVNGLKENVQTQTHMWILYWKHPAHLAIVNIDTFVYVLHCKYNKPFFARNFTWEKLKIFMPYA